MNRADLRAALSNANVQAFLRVIRESESRQDDSAYRLENDGTKRGRVLPQCPVEHPSKGLKSPPGRAFGAYQFLASTWASLVKRYGFEDMSPGCQNEAAVALIAGRGALDEVIAGDLDGAFHLLEKEWTSLPGGAEENAATARAREVFVQWGGTIKGAERPDWQDVIDAAAKPEPDPLATEHYGEAVTDSTIQPIPSADQQEAHNMPAPLIPIAIAAAQAFLPRLVELIPTLGAAFGSGSDVQKRNVAAATMIAEAVTRTAAEPNLQAAIEKIERDPVMLAEVRQAVNDILPTLVEAGGGGIKGAREAASAQSGDWRKLIFSLPFVAMLLFIPTIWAVVAAAVFKASWLLELDAQMRGTVIGFVMGTVAGSIVMYVYGASMTKSAPHPSPER